MPELPGIAAYLDRLERRILGARLLKVRRLYAGGEVHCAKYGSLMQNLGIGETGR